jgi:glyoxylase I family protein
VEPFDPAAIRARLKALGIAVDEPKRRFGAEGYGDSIYLTDPEGNGIELKGASEPEAR